VAATHAPGVFKAEPVVRIGMIRVGQEAPDFTLPGAAAGTIETHGLAEYTDRGWSVILVFYPFDFHPACTDQWCSLRDADWLTLLDDAVVLGVGADGAYAHREYANEHNIQFPLLSDTDGTVSRAYGVLTDDFEGHSDVPARAMFVVGPDDVVQFAWSAQSPDEQPALDALRAATNHRDGDATPADADESTPDADESASDADESTPDADESASDADESTPDADESASDADESTSDADESTSDADESTPDADESTPDADESTSDADGPSSDTGDSD
jgi:peroxiredoxin